MELNLDRTLFDIDGETPIGKKPRELIAHALYQVQLSPNYGDSYKQCKLADRVREGETTYTTEEVTTMKEVVGRQYPPIIIGQVIDILEGEPEKE